MMVLTFWLSRTLEMMQNDMRTSGIDVFLVYNWFWCMKSCLWTFSTRMMFLEFICVANECLCLLDVDEFEQNVFGIWMSFLHEFST